MNTKDANAKSINVKDVITDYMTGKLFDIFKNISPSFFEEITEIRIRANKPIILAHKAGEFFLSSQGEPTRILSHGQKPDIEDILKMIELISNYSLYAFEDEMRNGYITLQGGHRVGMTGKAVLEGGNIKTIKNINGLNIRISHEIKGCADETLEYILNKSVLHTMIISPPGCGKTTLLRDIIRQLSNGIEGKIVGQTVGVADERSELGGCYKGIAQNDLGIRTDILDGCPKAEGMVMLLRSMAPKVIAVDEIGKKNDIYALEDIINAGIKLICTVHGNSLEDIQQKPVLSQLLEKKIFERFVLLDKPGSIKGIYNKSLKDIYTKGRFVNVS